MSVEEALRLFLRFAVRMVGGSASCVVLGVTIALAIGCANPNYRVDACIDSSQCSEPTPACDTNAMICVQCTASESNACNGAAPVCGEDQTCRPCRVDTECASQVCGIVGSCLSADKVLYVSPHGTGDTCTSSQPCTLQTALTLFSPQRYTIKLSPGTYRAAVSLSDNQQLEIHGDDADLTRSDAGPIFEAQGLSTLTVIGLRIHNAAGIGTGHGVACSEVGGNMPLVTLHRVNIDRNQGRGVDALGCRLRLERSEIFSNHAGGILILNGTFVIVSNVILANGNGVTSIGGVAITTTPSSTNRLEFNSFSRNMAYDGLGSAIYCVAGAFTARNNIASYDDTLTNPAQLGGTCMHAYSIVRPGTLPPGIGNSSIDPMFKDATAGDLHLMPGSPAQGGADPASDLTGPAEFDIDGDKRTSPADIGADEVP